MKCVAAVVGVALFVSFDIASLVAAPPETVVVGSPGNAADTTGFGAVAYEFRIAKFETTNHDYCEFLNGVAQTDASDLYDSRMSGDYGGIERVGEPGKYRYRIKAGMGAKPVNYVTWLSAARYANWLTNGQGKADTESGSYAIDATDAAKVPDHAALAKGKKVVWAIATENEWYKAAYFDPNKPGGPGYWPYAAKSDEPPPCNLNTNAPSDAGAFRTAASPWGTFDQNGNVWEYNESVAGGKVGLRGGSFYLNDKVDYLRSTTRYDVLSAKWPNYGFRVIALGDPKAALSARGPGSKPAASKPAPPPIAKRKGPPKTFYVSQSQGNDDWSGESAVRNGRAGPWKTLARASIEYVPGDAILLKRGDSWNEELRPLGNGTKERPITIAAYGEGNRPLIDRQDDRQDRTGVRLSDQAGFKIVGLEFARCMTGIYADYSADAPERKHLWIEDCRFRDSLLYQPYQDYPQRKVGLGICFFSHERRNRIVLSDITIRNCVFERLTSGVWTNSPDNFNKNASFVYNFANMALENCRFEEGYQWQMGIRGVAGGVVRDCVTLDIGRNFRSFNGVAGAMFFRCKDWLFEDSEWGYVSIGLGSGDGEAFDFEGNCDNMTMRNCLFHDTDGPGFLLCCYASDGNPHRKILMERCVINAKSKRPIGLPRCAIVNTTDWNEAKWKDCRFYLSPGEALMKVMDPERDKRSTFENCLVRNLGDAGRSANLAGAADLSASTQTPDGAAAQAVDARVDSAWRAAATSPQWLQIEFRKPTTIREFRLKEASNSSIKRYAINCWDAKGKRWVSRFNGLEIGGEFVAPIVETTTTKVRLVVLRTANGNPAIAEFEAYDDRTAGIPHDAGGNLLPAKRSAD